MLRLIRVCVSDSIMSTLLTGAHTFNCSVSTFVAAIVPPVGRLQTLLENLSIGSKGSSMAPTVEVVPVLLTVDGMVPSFIPFVILSGVHPPRVRSLCLYLEFSYVLRLLLILIHSVCLQFHPFVSRWQDGSLNLTFHLGLLVVVLSFLHHQLVQSAGSNNLTNIGGGFVHCVLHCL